MFGRAATTLGIGPHSSLALASGTLYCTESCFDSVGCTSGNAFGITMSLQQSPKLSLNTYFQGLAACSRTSRINF